jgi:hypothetical protein
MAAAPMTDLDPGETLAGLELVVRRRRAVEVDDLRLVAHWCDLQSTDPRDDPRPDPTVPLPPGSDRLVRLGGAGTPRVRELSLCELGIARGVHVLAARAVAADVLDLRHRLPRTWAVFLSGWADAWLARRVASLTRDLSPVAVAVVDTAAAAAIAGEAPGRVLAIVEAKIIEADPAAHDAKVEAERRRRFVSLTRTDATGLRHVIARVTAGDAAYVDAVLSRVADILATHPEHADAPRDLLRSLAFGWLARPAELLTLLLEHTDNDVSTDAAAPAPETEPEPGQEPPAGPEPEPESQPEPEPQPGLPRALAFPADLLDALRRINPDRLPPTAVLYVHLHETALTGTGVARVEGLGPHSLTQLTELLGHTRVTVKPVIDLHDRISVNRYEHPTRIKERIHLQHPADVFPHASRVSRKLDLDHRITYRPTGPPGQTGTPNGQPLGRTGHRAKTHLGYTCVPLASGGILWRSPHGLHRLVDDHGTHPLDQDEADALTGTDPLQHALVRLLLKHRAGLL